MKNKKVKMPKKFNQIYSGEWVFPKRKGYLMKCCDCGLVHVIDFRLIKNKRGCSILMRAKRI